MPVYKCFGGTFDGQHQHIPNELKNHEPYRFLIRQKIQLAEFITNEPPKVIDHVYETYILELIRTSKITIKFLRHEKLTLEQILTKIFV